MQGNERFIRETGLAGRIAELVEPAIEDEGLRLVRVVHSGRDGGTVQIMVDRAGGQVTLDDCSRASRAISPLLDAHDPVAGAYRLEVSSAGIDRPLVRASDFEDWQGFEAKVELRQTVDGRKRFRGLIEGLEDGELRLRMKLKGYDTDQVLGFPADLIETAKLVMTDELVKAALAKDNAAKT